MTTKIHLVSYGDQNYTGSKIKLKEEAEKFNKFESITMNDPSTLDGDFRNKFQPILNQRFGGGFWIWKIQVIKQKLHQIPDDDFLIYLDAGCIFNIEAEQKFNEYIEIVQKSEYGILSFQMTFPEREWTTRQVFEHLKVEQNDPVALSGQLVGGIIVMRKCEHVLKIVEQILEVYTQNPLLITNTYNSINQYPYFKDHRHDQSISSIIRKNLGTEILPDETYFENWDSDEAKKYPFWAKRRRIAD